MQGLGTRVRDLRIARGLTQLELARLTGLDPQTIWKIEGARNVPTLESAVRLAQALGISMDELAPSTPGAAA